MGNVSSTLRHFSCMVMEDRRNPATDEDETVSQINELLNVLKASEPFLPEAAAVVPILHSIVRQIRKIHSNKNVTRELELMIRGLVESVKTGVENVRGCIKSSTQPLSHEQSNSVKLFGERIMRLKGELEVLQTKMAKVRRWSFLRKLRRPRNKVMAQIEEVKGILTKVKWNFQNEEDGVTNALNERVDALVDESTVSRSELDARRNEMINVDSHNGEATAGTRSSQHRPNPLSTASVKNADEPTPDSPQDLSEASKGNPNDKLNTTLDSITILLDALGGVAEFVPVTGIASAVSIVRVIVDQFRKTTANSDTAAELAEDIKDLLAFVDETVKAVQGSVTSIEKTLDERQSAALELDQFNNSDLFGEMVAGLKTDLENVSQAVEEAQKGGFFTKLRKNSEIESKLVEAKRRLENAVKSFQGKQTILITLTVQSIYATVKKISSTSESIRQDEGKDPDIALVKQDEWLSADLAKLKHVEGASYRVFSDVGLLKGTRKHLIHEAMKFANRPDMAAMAKIFVLYGAAGTGKTTFAREICRLLQEANKLGASFFFRNDAGELGSTEKVFLTIAYQLGNLQHALRPQISSAAREYAKFPPGSPEEQLKSLIMEPVKRARAQNDWLANVPIIIVLDALDEAGRDLCRFLKLLKSLVDAHYNFMIFVTSRHEQSVEHAFQESGMGTMTVRLNMDDVPRVEVDSDIQHFLQERFASLRYQRKLLSAHPDAIEMLTEKAERLFIYARTVIEHLDHKVEETSLRRLDAILHDGAGRVGLPALDDLYIAVLKNAYDEETLEGDDVRARVDALLAGLVAFRQAVTVEVLAPLMGLGEEALIRTVRELRSILSCSSEDLRTAIIRPLHLTFAEFLVDSKRSKGYAFSIDRRACHLLLTKACLRILNTELRDSISENDDARSERGKRDARTGRDERIHRDSLLRKRLLAYGLYACRHWATHMIENEPTSDLELLELLDGFCRKKLLRWIEAMVYMCIMNEARAALLRAYLWTKECEGYAYVSNILFDGWQFLSTFREGILSNPEQIYTSLLSLTPVCSLVKLYADKDWSNCMLSPRDRNWGTYLYTLEFSNEAELSYDGRLLVMIKEGEVEIRDALTGCLRKTLKNSIRGAVVHPNGRSLLSIRDDRLAEEWDLLGDKGVVRTYELSEATGGGCWCCMRARYSVDGTRLTCCGEEQLLVWSTEDRSQPVKRIPIDPTMEVRTFSADGDCGQMAAVLSPKGKSPSTLAGAPAPLVVKYWSINTGEEIKSLPLPIDLYCSQFAKQNTMLC